MDLVRDDRQSVGRVPQSEDPELFILGEHAHQLVQEPSEAVLQLMRPSTLLESVHIEAEAAKNHLTFVRRTESGGGVSSTAVMYASQDVGAETDGIGVLGWPRCPCLHLREEMGRHRGSLSGRVAR